MQLHKWLALAAFAAAGCAGPTPGGCRDDLECPMNNACVAGRCRPLASEGDLAQPEVADMAPAPAPDLATSGGDAGKPGGDMAGGLCNFNGDGVITRDELPAMIGLGGLFVVNPAGQTVTVALKAQNGAWDFSAPVQGEQKVFDQLIAPSGTWWEKDFPGATYAQRLDANQAFLGVFKLTQGALSMLGVVSETGGLTQTSLKYATPIDVVRFPLKVGASWTSESTVSGLASGVLFAGSEKYVFTVDQRGTVKVPAGSFDTLRLRFDYTQTVGFATTASRISYIHMAECYGNVARIRSKDGEKQAEFTTASEYRRMSTP